MVFFEIQKYKQIITRRLVKLIQVKVKDLHRHDGHSDGSSAMVHVFYNKTCMYTHTHKYIYLHTYIHSNSINIDFQVSARVLRVAWSQPCYRIKIILVKEEYTHSLYSMDYASTARGVLSFLGFFFSFSCRVTKGVTRAIYRVSQRRQRGSARVSGCQSLRMCTNDMGKTPFLSGSPSMCPIWKQKITYVRGNVGDAV